MTSEETLQYLSQYPQNQLETALAELGYSLDSTDLPENIVESIEAILESASEAVASRQQQLPSAKSSPAESTKEDEAIVVQETANMMAEILDVRNVQINPKALFAVAQCAINDAKAQAAALDKICRQTLAAELRKGQQQRTDDLLEVMKANHQLTQEIFSDANLQKMVNQAVPEYQPKVDLDVFIREVRLDANRSADREQERVRVGNEVRASKVDFDLDGFLNEVWR